MKRRKRRLANSESQNETPGPNRQFPRLSHEDALEISLQREIDVRLWSKGKAYLPALAKKLELTGRHRKAANNPMTKRIKAQKADLRRKIASCPEWLRDFEFFTRALGWDPETLLQHLYWDSNMMRADPQTVISGQKRRIWPIDMKMLEEILLNIRGLVDQIDQLNKTDLSPVRTAILRDEKGHRLCPADERFLLKAFRNLPDILSFYGGDFSRKLSDAKHFWLREEKEWESMVEDARRNSLFERIRARTGKYHSVHLHRLVSLSQQVRGIPPISQRAFTMWLNRLKKRQLEIDAVLHAIESEVRTTLMSEIETASQALRMPDGLPVAPGDVYAEICNAAAKNSGFASQRRDLEWKGVIGHAKRITDLTLRYFRSQVEPAIRTVLERV